LPETSISTKPLAAFSSHPKFKTQLKEKEAGKWYLFLQVFENSKSSAYQVKEDTASTSLELRCKIVSGDNDSIIADKVLFVSIQRSTPPEDQVRLVRLPAYPASLVQGFDRMATWLFEPEPFSQRTLKFKPACIFQKIPIPDTIITKLVFQYDVMGIHQLTKPTFTLSNANTSYEKIGIKRNLGGRSLGGAFTLLTGLSSVKTKYSNYLAVHTFNDKDSTYHCMIGYTEEESADRARVKSRDGSYSMESSDFKVSARYTDPNFLNVITLEADTIARFYLSKQDESLSLTSYDQLWDGSDTTTIAHLPPEWNNSIAEKDIVLTGTIGKDSFTMKTRKGKRIKEFYINDLLVVTIQGRDIPVNGQVFHPISSRQLKIFTILSSFSFDYLNNIYAN
jgi:hypothetical protein